MLNKAIQRIVRDCNEDQFEKEEHPQVLLPHFSCHNLRHTFTTRMVEAGVNVKVIQDTLGHQDISTTMNIYADVTKELKKSEFEGLDTFFKTGKKADKTEPCLKEQTMTTQEDICWSERLRQVSFCFPDR